MGAAAVPSAAVAAAGAAGIEEDERGAAGAAALGAERNVVDESESGERQTCYMSNIVKFSVLKYFFVSNVSELKHLLIIFLPRCTLIYLFGII